MRPIRDVPKHLGYHGRGCPKPKKNEPDNTEIVRVFRWAKNAKT